MTQPEPGRFRIRLRHLMLAIAAASLLLLAVRDSIRGWFWPPQFPQAQVKAATERARRAALGQGRPGVIPANQSTGDPPVIAPPGLP